MGNLFANLPVPAGNGSGAWVDVAAFGKQKTITNEGTYTGTVIVEVSLDGGTTSAQLIALVPNSEKIIDVACDRMRVTRTGVDNQAPGSADINVGAVELEDDVSVASLAVPAGNGIGATTDISEFPTFKTVTVAGGGFSGSLFIDITENGTEWNEVFTFTARGLQSKSFTAAGVRVRRSGADRQVPGTAIVNIAAAPDGDGGGGSGGGAYALPETWGQVQVPATQAATAMECLVSQAFSTRNAIKAGSIVGIGIRFDATVTAGTATARVTIGGVAGTLSVAITGGTVNQAVQDDGIDSYVAGALIGVTLQTAGLAPNGTAACEVWLLVQDED